MKKTFALAVTAIALALPTLSSAQFANPLSGLMGGKSSGNNASTDMGAQQDSLVRTYVAANNDVWTANVRMTKALNLNTDAINKAETAKTFSGTDTEAQATALSESAAALSEAQKHGATLKDAEAKTKYAQGVVSLAMGVKKYMDMSKEAQSFASGMSSVSPLQMGKLQSGVYIAKSLPGNVSNLTDTLKNAIQFAKDNNVDLKSNDPTGALGSFTSNS